MIPLILLCAAYLLVLAVSLALYSARLWTVRKQIAQIPRRLEKVGKPDRERKENALAKSALVAFGARPAEDGEVGGRDMVIKEIPASLRNPEQLGELGMAYEKLRWGRGGGEGDEMLWEGLMRGVARILKDQSENSSLKTGSSGSIQRY